MMRRGVRGSSRPALALAPELLGEQLQACGEIGELLGAAVAEGAGFGLSLIHI